MIWTASMRSIEFTLPFALESLNVRDRKSHWERSRDKQNMSWHIMAAIGGPAHYPRPPFRKVRITVNRASAKMLDPDNLVGSVKNLADCLCQKSDTHPTGVGIIMDDSPDLLELTVTQSNARPLWGHTDVKIECLDD
jgi:hypothetical protein